MSGIDTLLFAKKEELVEELRRSDFRIWEILGQSTSLPEARDNIFSYLDVLERQYFNIHSPEPFKELHICERANAKECITALKNIIRTENERITSYSALHDLRNLAKGRRVPEYVHEGFLHEFIHLFRGINGTSNMRDDIFVMPANGEEAAALRSQKLDAYAALQQKQFSRFRTGMHPALIEERAVLEKKIRAHFGANEQDWQDYRWHLTHIIKDVKTLTSLVQLNDDERAGVLFAEQHGIPVHITPYYLSLFHEQGRTRTDKAVRAQVLPSLTYAQQVLHNRTEDIDMDFMGEKSTTPIAGITRRYPEIVILKPINACPQICVYCQRNWELKTIDEGHITHDIISSAISWIADNKHITEVLVTGGDPLLLADNNLENVLEAVSAISHIERIRIGTRTFVTLPFRFTDDLVAMLKRYHEWGKREVCLVTHVEHPAEITPELVDAVRKVRESGMSVYNQQVFTYYNSLKFETALLRKSLKLAGIDPYYTFNTKGKEETIDFRVPLARIQQERKEEARFLPGLVRTDESVFNVPLLGKSHLRAGQDHALIMILGSGQRVYRFFPWESKVSLVDDYIYTDVSIHDYLTRLASDGEQIEAYKSIWYYF
ncbi:MAG: KamA family radical SAM protein [archaeon]